MDSADFKIKETIILENTVDRKEKAGTPDRTRTCDLLIRSQTLYPAELRAHWLKVFFIMPEFNGFFKLIKSKEKQCRFDESKPYIIKQVEIATLTSGSRNDIFTV